MTTLLVHATRTELGARGPFETLEVGVGPVRAAVRLTRRLTASTVDRVCIVGVAGAFPVRHRSAGLPELPVGAACLVDRECFGDQGVETPNGFLSLADLGLEQRGLPHAESAGTASLAAALELPIVSAVTVSCGSATESRSSDMAARTGASVETMEGAALALVCEEFEVPWVQLRAISNETGDRDRAGWDLEVACSRIDALVRTIAERGLLT